MVGLIELFSIITLEDIIVTARRDSLLSRVKEVKPDFSRDLSQELRESGCISIRTYAGIASFGIRGSGTEENTLLLEGIKIENPISYANLIHIPNAFLRRIAIFPSGASSYFGSNGIGGVLSFNLRRKPYIYYSYGSFSTHEAGFVLSKNFYNASLIFGTDILYSKNNYTYRDEFERTYTWRNADISKGSFYTLARLNNIKYVNFTSYMDTGSPGIIGSELLNTRIKDLMELNGLVYKNEYVRVKLSGAHFYNHYISKDFNTDDTHASGDISINLKSVSKKSFWASYSYQYAKSTRIGQRKRHILKAGYIFSQWKYYTGAFRIEELIGHKPVILMDLSFIRDNFSISASRNFRMPTMNELYWPEELFARGNVALKNEYGYDVECGYRLEQFKGFIYARIIENYISWINNKGVYEPTNLERVYVYGFDLYYKFHIKSLMFLLEASLNRSLYRGYQLQYRPLAKVVGSIKYRGAGLEWIYISPRPEITGPTRYMKAVILFNALYKRAYKKLMFGIMLNNIFDVSYQSVRGYPTKGRNIKIWVNIKI